MKQNVQTCGGGGDGGGGSGEFTSHALKYFLFGSDERLNYPKSSLVSLTSQPIIIEW